MHIEMDLTFNPVDSASAIQQRLTGP